MAIGRSGMTKEFFGNRQKAKKPKKMAMGGVATPTDMMNTRGRNIAAMAQQGGMKEAMSAPSRIVPGGMPPRGMGGMPPSGRGGMPRRGMGMMPKGPTPQTAKPAMAMPSIGGTPSMGGTQEQMMAQIKMQPAGRPMSTPQVQLPIEAPAGTPVRDPNAPVPSRADPMMKKGGVVKKAKGGSVRGCGCAVRGTKGAKVY